MAEFWGALAKIRVKLTVSRHGIPRWEKFVVLVIFGMGLIVFGALEHFGSLNWVGLYGGIKYLFAALGVIILGFRSAVFVYTINKDIMAMSGTEGAVTKAKLSRQLKIKFGVFITCVLGFAVFCLTKVHRRFTTRFFDVPLTSDWTYTYDVPIAQILYVPAVYSILIQFANITTITCYKPQRVTDKQTIEENLDHKNTDASSTNHAVTTSMHAKQVHSASMSDIIKAAST